MDSNPIGLVSLSKGEIWIQTGTEGETGVMLLQAKECQRLSANCQNLGEAWIDSSQPCPHLYLELTVSKIVRQ